MPWPLRAVMFVGVVPAAMVLHHLVERPAREIMRRHGVPFARLHRPLAARIAQLSTARR